MRDQREYEIVYVFRSNLLPEDIDTKIERYHGVVTSSGGEITAVQNWGRRDLAYPIQKQRAANYVVARFLSDGSPLMELERILKLDDDLLRHLVVIAEGDLPDLAVSVQEADAASTAESAEASEEEATASAEEGEASNTDENPEEDAGPEGGEADGSEEADSDDTEGDDTEETGSEEEEKV